MSKTYLEFIKDKVLSQKDTGFNINQDEINPLLKPHQKDIVQWMIQGGRRACFASFGLGKTFIQLEAVRLTLTRCGGMGLIVLPLGVRGEFIRDAEKLNIPVEFIRRIEETDGQGIYLTNYETVRDGKLDPRLFTVSSLDEAAVLRGFGGTKTFREFMALFAGDDRRDFQNPIQGGSVKYRYVATATPSPNDYIELLAYAAYLDIMDVSAAKTRFFKRDSTKADNLTIHPHKEQEFWLWVASWAIVIQKPSDLGHSDEGYDLPDLDIHWHEVHVEKLETIYEKNGQGRFVRNAALGIQDASKEKKISLDVRIKKLLQLRNEDPVAHRVIWHDLEVERHAIAKVVPGVRNVFGSQNRDEQERIVNAFANGEIQEIGAKPCQFGAGVNWQRHCSWAIYLGIGFKFNDFAQSLHRLHRFLQPNKVRVDIIYTDGEAGIRTILEDKWTKHKEMVRKMTDLIKEYGLSHAAMMQKMKRALGVERVEVSGDNYTMINNDSVIECGTMKENSAGLILTSIPFSTQYEYSPNYCDFGHSDGNNHFFQQMDYLTPELFRVLQPGRIAAIHVKDRIVPMGMSGMGSQTVYPLHCDAIAHYTKHGFAYMGMKTVVTDVVRENNQTYRLGWTEQCKDGTKMGVGMPEYLLLFRKPPTDSANAYADNPVVKSKRNYTRSKWQIDAHAFARSAGDRLMNPEEIKSLSHGDIFKLFRQYTLEQVYNFVHHVKIGEELDIHGRLPVTFMLLQPHSWHPDVWTDITRMMTLNTSQQVKGKVMHLCPMQFDLADRIIEQLSNVGDIVLDPFAGIGTVPYRAILQGRYGMGIELSHSYFLDAAMYCKAAEDKIQMPSLFDTCDNVEEIVEVSHD